MRTINVEQGMPVVEQAKLRLRQGLRIAKANREKAVKVIHGYGSSGRGGGIKHAVLIFLEEKKKEGFIKDYCRGEEFTPFFESGRNFVELAPHLKKDADYGMQNDCVTIVIMF